MENLPLNIDFGNVVADLSLKTIAAYILAISMSLLFAVLADLIFKVAFYKNNKGIEVNKAFIILAPAVTTIFLVIQFSLPLSLGLLGALSFVRFRTPIKEPEEIGFILILISTSLACAVFKFELALILLSLVFVAVVLRKSAILSFLTNIIFFKSSVDIFITENGKKDTCLPLANQMLQEHFSDVKTVSVSEIEGMRNLHLKALDRNPRRNANVDFVDKLKGFSAVTSVNVLYDQ